MRHSIIMLAMVSALALPAVVQANTSCDDWWGAGTLIPPYTGVCTDGECVGGYNDGGVCMSPAPCGAIFCDDFDRYFIDAPPAPDQCPTGASPAVGPLRAVWQLTSTNPNGPCGTEFSIEEDTDELTSAPFGGRYPCQADAQLGQSTVDLTSRLEAHFGPGYDMVYATNDNGLTLGFSMSGGINLDSTLHWDTGYMELALNDDHAPMDYIRVGVDELIPENPGCISCYRMCPGPNYSVHVAWPHVCQSYEPRLDSPRCPPLQTNIRAAIAIGTNALLDNDPCHCGSSNQKPNNAHLSYYDGLKWRILRSNFYGGGTGYGDFTLGDKIDDVRITVRATTVDIYHRARVGGVWTTSEAFNVPRLYTGPFNKLRGGAAHGCELNNGSYTCAGNTRCIRVGDTRCDPPYEFQTTPAGHVAFDFVYLLGGLGSSTDGACCDDDGACDITSGTNCINLGYRFQGAGTICDPNPCCPRPWADIDRDGDVDQTDFNTLQLCFSGNGSTAPTECRCWDRDNSGVGDGDVDADDYAAFAPCWTGPNVPYNIGSLPSGCE